jgi:ribosome maturation factor RimP
MAQQRGRAVERPPRQQAPRPVGSARAGVRAADLERLRVVAERAAAECGYDLEHLSVKRVGQRYLVQVTVDSDAGVDLDHVAVLSRRISADLDAAEASGGEVVPGEYDLEVGSPGTDRPLTLPRHWRRNAGRLVSVRVGRRQVAGRVSAADDDGVLLDLDGTVERFGYDDLGPGRVQIEFSRVDDDGIDDEREDEE